MSVSLYMLRDVSDLDVNIISKSGHIALHWVVYRSKKTSRRGSTGGGGGLSGAEAPQFYANPFPPVFPPNMG